MLLQFNFENYKSFREETSLDLTATGISENSNHKFQIGQESVLPITTIYGANASGKTNVIEALAYMHYYIITSFGFDPEERDETIMGFKAPRNFAFDNTSKNKPSLFEVYFIKKEATEKQERVTTYNYGFTVDKDGVVEEWLNTKAKTAKDYKQIFYRNEKEGILELKGLTKRQGENLQVSLRKQTLILSLGAKLNIKILQEVYDWFRKNEIINFAEPVTMYLRENRLPEGFTTEKTIREDVVKYLSSFDDSIIGFEVSQPIEDQEGVKSYKVETIHRSVDSTETHKINIADESAGTLKMFSLYQDIKDVLEEGSLLVIDELNARLHPIMLNNIIHTFTNKTLNPNGAQLIFTTHDVYLLDSKLLRRDEIWFTEKIKGESTLYSLADFEDERGNKIRKDEDYLKNYLVGKYGAIPHLKDIDFNIGEAND